MYSTLGYVARCTFRQQEVIVISTRFWYAARELDTAGLGTLSAQVITPPPPTLQCQLEISAADARIANIEEGSPSPPACTRSHPLRRLHRKAPVFASHASLTLDQSSAAYQ